MKLASFNLNRRISFGCFRKWSNSNAVGKYYYRAACVPVDCSDKLSCLPGKASMTRDFL
jgi:hypothetical protein